MGLLRRHAGEPFGLLGASAGLPAGQKMRSYINAGIEEGQQVVFPLFVSFWGGAAALRPQAGIIGEGDIQ